MNKLLYCVLAILGCSHYYPAAAQPVNVKIQVPALLISGPKFDVELATGNRLSLQATVGGAYRNVDLWTTAQGRYLALTINGQVRYYLMRPFQRINDRVRTSQLAPYGAYTGALLGYTWGAIDLMLKEQKGNLMSGSAYRAGLLIGWQQGFTFGQRTNAIVLDVTLGGMFQITDIDARFHSTGQFGFFKTSGFQPHIGLGIGVSIGDND